jgi:hypothetical protein
MKPNGRSMTRTRRPEDDKRKMTSEGNRFLKIMLIECKMKCGHTRSGGKIVVSYLGKKRC